jgi:hypothetical protein
MSVTHFPIFDPSAHTGKKLRKVDIKSAEIWPLTTFHMRNSGNFFSQFAEIWENVAELWCFPDFTSRFFREKNLLYLI